MKDAGFRSAGILPADFAAYPHGKIAGETPALQNAVCFADGLFCADC
jgi:hypothetical protein